jgi:4-methylaminobutanoate oxidase (formaldehyde-forming)
MAGVSVPLMAAEHFYVVTDASPDIPRNLPVLRVPDECAYVKEEAGKLLVGFFELRGKPLPDGQIPEDSEFLTLPDDWDHLARELELASERLPILKRIGVHTFFNGPESFTPDGRWILGEAPGLRNFFVAAGFNSIGIQTSGGAGLAIAEWMEAGEPTFDLTPTTSAAASPSRPTPPTSRTASARHSACTTPISSPTAARRAHAGCARHRCTSGSPSAAPCFAESAGWERPCLVPAGARTRARREGSVPLQLGRGRAGSSMPPMSTRPCATASACSTCRRSARSASRVATRRPCCSSSARATFAVAPGRIVYTHWLNRNGGVEADLTVSRLSTRCSSW